MSFCPRAETRLPFPSTDFSSTLMASKDWRALRITDPEERAWWDGLVPRLLFPPNDRRRAPDPGIRADVEVAGDGGGADVKPVGIIGRQFLVRPGLDNVDPLGDGEFAGALEVLGVGLDKLLGINLLNTLDGHFGGARRVSSTKGKKGGVVGRGTKGVRRCKGLDGLEVPDEASSL